ncbi:hypothetical protein BT67DRAFT_424801 [Trichocladium antarcticum]|uniref:Non-canonical purine NTP phosphatase/PRRC1 domain-containing protein n=1 Tax=Trichocladium antarcticum TaxID=1450529 RepID=A0AAN6UH47_9PEZI|nr:hypothetical protein BT67DRAFT_424801 [Trichocladium antarcticum]
MPQQTPNPTSPSPDNQLETSLSLLRGSETIVPPPPFSFHPPPNPPASIIPHASRSRNRNRNNVLALIPTKNTHKAALIRAHLLQHKPADIRLQFRTFDADPGVGEQPYDSAGLQGAVNRCLDAARQAAAAGVDGAGADGVGWFLVGSVENYIARPGGRPWREWGGEGRPVDYGVVVFARVELDDAGAGGVWEWRVGLSEGVTVPVEYWRRAEADGFEDAEGRYGKRTVGEVLAASVRGPALDKADWHQVVAGKSRYALLKDAMEKVEVPWPTPEDGGLK